MNAKLNLSHRERRLLDNVVIDFDPDRAYTVAELLVILEAVYAQEIFYAQNADEKSTARDRAEEYAALANLIFSQIPSE